MLFSTEAQMKKKQNTESVKGRLTFEPLTLKNWSRFTELFGEHGASGNCWCMYYRLDNKSFKEGQKNGGNYEKMHELVKHGKQVGLLCFLGEKAVGWCALSPREDFIRLEKSRIHKRLDDEPVWSVPCFYIDKKYRDSGVSGDMLRGAIRFAEENGIKILEGYPAIPVKDRIPDAFAWYGIYGTFEKAGFEVEDNKSPNRPLMRYHVKRNT